MNSRFLRAKNKVYEGLEMEKEKEWQGPFCFIQSADTQFGMLRGMVPGISEPSGDDWTQEIRLTNMAVEAANNLQPRPRFFVVCGDLVQAFPGEKYKEAQEADFKKCFSALHPDIALICVCGNHDIGNTPTKDAIEKYRSSFGDDYFTFWCGGVKCIVLNSQYYEDPSLVQEMAKEQELWLDEQLNDVKGKHTIVFQHIPWFLHEPEEEKEYFNMVKDLRMRMLKKFEEAGVAAIFCGHYHRNAGGFYKNMELIVTSAIGMQLGDDKSGMRIVRVLDNAIKHQYYALEDVPTKIVLQD